MRTIGRTLSDSRGQALPIAIGALALGALLVLPMLRGASTSSRATGLVGQRAVERYSMDAGIEWSGWRLMSDPLLTADTSFTDTPLLPLPPTINGRAFPDTQIRRVPGEGAVELQEPAWNYAGPDTCIEFSAAEPGTVSIRLTTSASEVWMAVLPETAPCSRPAIYPVWGSSPFSIDAPLPAAGTYKLYVGIDAAPASASIEMSVPAATYEVRSTEGSRETIARIIAGYAGVKVASWQLN